MVVERAREQCPRKGWEVLGQQSGLRWTHSCRVDGTGQDLRETHRAGILVTLSAEAKIGFLHVGHVGRADAWLLAKVHGWHLASLW